MSHFGTPALKRTRFFTRKTALRVSWFKVRTSCTSICLSLPGMISIQQQNMGQKGRRLPLFAVKFYSFFTWAIVCPRLDFGLPSRFAGPGGLAECDQPGKNPSKYSAIAAGIKPGPFGGQTVTYIHAPTELSWLTILNLSSTKSRQQLNAIPVSNRKPSTILLSEWHLSI